MSYKRSAQERTKALRARLGEATGEDAPRAYHRHTELRGGAQLSKKSKAKRGHVKHKGGW